jgi:mono/diheme cytochrome c family protein
MWKKVLIALGGVVGATVLLLAGGAIYVQATGIPRYDAEKVDLHVDPTPERVARGRKLATLLCATCHMDPTSHQLTGKRLVDTPPKFGVAFSRNITRHQSKGIGSWSDGQIAYLLRTGVRPDGQYLLPWMPKLPHLCDEDMASIIAFLRSDDPLVAAADLDPPGVSRPSFLAKVLAHVAFKKLPYPSAAIKAPSLDDPRAHGRYLVAALDCYSCHSSSFETVDLGEPEKSAGYLGGGNRLIDLRGETVRSANITFDEETGIGRWSEAQFARALRQGFRPDNTPIHYPMMPMPELTDREVTAIFTYLGTVPKIRNSVGRAGQADALAAGADDSAGRHLYDQYGCVSCHGDSGVGIADLRQAAQHFPTRARLKAWIEDAPSMVPNTKMPPWRGVIAEADYDPLMAYVLRLGSPPADGARGASSMETSGLEGAARQP